MHEAVQGGAEERWASTEEKVTFYRAEDLKTPAETPARSDAELVGWRLTVAAGDPVHHEPPDVEHADVVVDVEEGDLVVVLPEDEEEGVHELHQLGEVVPPQHVDDLQEGQTHGRVLVWFFFTLPPKNITSRCCVSLEPRKVRGEPGTG